MRLKPLFEPGTGGFISSRQVIELLKELGKQTPPPHNKEGNKAKILVEAARLAKERETG